MTERQQKLRALREELDEAFQQRDWAGAAKAIEEARRVAA